MRTIPLVTGSVPMSAACQISVLVPVYDEPVALVLRVLRSLVAQTGVGKERYEVVMVVNNSRQEAEERSEAYGHNQATLELLRFLSGRAAVCQAGLDDARQQDAAAIRASGLALRVLDKSSLGCADALNNCGSAKNYGGGEICRRFEAVPAGKNGVIALLDCDCRVSENFLAEILTAFEISGVNMVTGKWLTEADPVYPHSEVFEQAAAIHFGADHSIRNYAPPAARLPIQLQKRDKLKKAIRPNGHNMAVSVKAWQAVAGFPRMSSFDDLLFVSRIAELPGDIARNPNYWVCNLLRPSERAGMASIGRRMKAIAESLDEFVAGKRTEVQVFDLWKINQLFRTVTESLNARTLTPGSLHGYLKAYGVYMEKLEYKDIEELHATIVEEYETDGDAHGWRRTESLVLARFYHRLPKRAFSED